MKRYGTGKRFVSGYKNLSIMKTTTRIIMADEQRVCNQRDLDRKELAEKLDNELEEHIKNVYEKNKNFEYTDGLTEDNIDEQLRLIPAFSNEAPTQEDIDKSPALQALQAIKYETEDPHECALSHKDDGNYHFQRKQYKKAIIAYTEGLKQKHDDHLLIAVLYTNRAASHFYLGNNRSALNDAVWALKSKPDHIKAILRGAVCCFDMEKYDECIEWCEKGLKVDDTNGKKLLDLKKKANYQKKQLERDRRKNEMKAIKNLMERNNLIDAIRSRKIAIEHMDGSETNEDIAQILLNNSTPHSSKIYLDENKQLHWPVYFLYPEYNQSDFIEDFCEHVKLVDQLSVVFATLPEWDIEKGYEMKNIKIFFEDVQRSLLIEVPTNKTLGDILSDKRFLVRGGCPALLLISAKSNYYKETFENQKAEVF